MNHIIHFAKHFFHWELKGFVIVNLITIFLLILMEFAPTDMISVIGFFLFCISSVYSLLFPISGRVYPKQPSWESAFSGKYLHALPMSKAQLIFVLAFSRLYVLVPMFILLVWVATSQRGNKMLYGDIIGDYFLSFLVLVFLLYSYIKFAQISLVIELRRKMYNKGRLSNFLLHVKSGLNSWLVAFIVFITLTMYWRFGTSLPTLVAMAFYIFIQFKHLHKSLCDEELPYWSTKREVLHIAIHFLVALFLFWNSGLMATFY